MKLLAISTICLSVLLAGSTATLATAPAGQATKTTTAAPAPEHDPICGMSVDPAKAKDAGLTSVFEGKTFYFCGADCKKQFDADPAKFAAAAKSGTTGSGMKGCCRRSGGTSGGGSSSGRMCGRMR